MGKVILVGAGPGDPDLITLKGLRAIMLADVIVYDKNIPKKLLEYARRDCKLIYVGKDPYNKNIITQEEINKILEDEARRNNVVVRLKCGDPYIFGRGAEECEYLLERGIECEVVPGVSSINGVLAYAGIPLTAKGVAECFYVCSAIVEGGRLFNFSSVPKECTLVILMISKNFSKIIDELIQVRGPNELAAIIEKGTTECQNVREGKLIELRNEKVESPALLVVGRVIEFRRKLWKLS
ncbi:MAG: uroporphyrinogen-III C-methyltransferase [Sulfolobaceae archaeon]